MKVAPLELNGQQFGHITITGKGTKSRYWAGTCDCSPDVSHEFNGSRLAAGKIKDCGCQRVNHGHTAGGKRSSTYIAWQDMKSRRAKSKYIGVDGQPHYSVAHDLRWLKFENFLADMGERPPGTTLDRIDPLNRVYAKPYCRWATRQVQDYNKTNTKIYFAEPGNLRMAGSALDWAEHFSEGLGVGMSVAEFKTIMKFVTVGQFWCSVHPSALDVAGLRKLVKDKRDDKWDADLAESHRKDGEEQGYTGDAVANEPALRPCDNRGQAKRVEAKVSQPDAEAEAREFFRKNPVVGDW